MTLNPHVKVVIVMCTVSSCLGLASCNMKYADEAAITKITAIARGMRLSKNGRFLE